MTDATIGERTWTSCSGFVIVYLTCSHYITSCSKMELWQQFNKYAPKGATPSTTSAKALCVRVSLALACLPKSGMPKSHMLSCRKASAMYLKDCCSMLPSWLQAWQWVCAAWAADASRQDSSSNTWHMQDSTYITHFLTPLHSLHSGAESSPGQGRNSACGIITVQRSCCAKCNMRSEPAN